MNLTRRIRLLPEHWQLRLVDLNTAEISEEDWQWADIVCIGGKQPQERSHLALVEEAKRRKIFCVVGGPNPSAQQKLFSSADCIVVGEGETTFTQLLADGARHPERVPGLAFRDATGNVASTPPRTDLPPLGQLPSPYLSGALTPSGREVILDVMRGCVFHCRYCSCRLDCQGPS